MWYVHKGVCIVQMCGVVHDCVEDVYAGMCVV